MRHHDDIPEDFLRDVGLDGDYAEYNDYDDYNVSIKLPAPTEFPTEYMPTSCKRLIREASEAIGCPPEFVALPMLSVLGSAIGNSRMVELKGGWTEKAVVFSTVIGDPASKKSPAAKVATKPAKKLQIELRNRYREAYEDYERQMREHEKDKRGCRKDGVTEPRPPEEPVMERTVVDDTTVEALSRVHRQSPRGVLAAKDELTGWLRGMDQYKAGGRGSDRQFWLSAWNSDAITVDRKGSPEALMIDEPFVGITGGIQPEVLEDLNRGPEDGMLDRFLCAYPDPVAPGWHDAEITEMAQTHYSNLYQRLRMKHCEIDEQGDPHPKKLSFSTSAKGVLVDFINEHSQEMNRPGFPAALKGVYGKLEAYIGRLSLILAMCRSVEEGAPETIEARDVVSAYALVSYFRVMARRVYAAIKEANPLDTLAEELAAFLETKGGTWKGEPSELYLQIKSRNKPPRVNEFSKMLKAAAGRQPGMDLSTVVENYTKADGSRSTRRVVTLTLIESS